MQSLIFVWLLLTTPSFARAEAPVDQRAKQVWQLLDYIAVDYGSAVKDGAVVSKDEYAEMMEFASAAARQLGELPAGAAAASLRAQAQKLQQLIAQKADPELVGTQARQLAKALLLAYPVTMAPKASPDLTLGARLYQNQCSACHGATGRADGPLAASLNPAPIAFTDMARARQRTPFALHQIISNGVGGTSMPAFAALSDDERWALAFYASTLSNTDSERQAGARLWASDRRQQNVVADLAALSATSEATLAASLGDQPARALLAYLRSTPAAVVSVTPDTLALAKTRLSDSVQALQRGDHAEARRLALSAYLDGFEPVEPALAAKNKYLFEEIEKAMGSYRGALGSGSVASALSIAGKLQALLSEAQEALRGSTDPLSTFVGALTILLREGVEALLVVVAMISFLKKAERTDVLPYLHAGWVSALAAGGATWAIATYVVDVSGASRELTEGVSAIFAAVMLLGVGMWMHQKSIAGRWQAYVKATLTVALSRQSAAVLFLLAFVTVYREVFETVLFYAALWTPGNGGYMLAGLGAGIVLLCGMAFLLLRSAARLPISQFFAVSSALVAILAVILMGKGVAALQKVGYLALSPVSIPRIDVLGIYPSLQTLSAQLMIVAIIVATGVHNMRSRKKVALAGNA
ncbi:MAG: cytochrome c/FTR1 family iron permease [Pseudomonadota bacterium]